ncbi:PVV-CTERM domain-containing choice-of-anchor G protein [Microbacterium sp. 22296]|uniref:PVV-CTERM domain-containing choice-of-anchor G protein n=1 Tax=Microbacterium sp. 22296 TaxID=3453903 RepID=UPI003F83DCEE
MTIRPHTSARTWRTVRAVGATAAVAALLVPATAANAAPADVVSQGTGRLVQTSLLGTDILDAVVALRGANAVNTDASGDVIVDQPLDAEAIAGLIALQAGSTNLFGDNGIIQLGAVGQYARANDDGSSSAFSGAVSAAPSLIGVGTVTPSSVGDPSAENSASITVGGADALAGLQVNIGTLAASALNTTDGTQTGQYVVADVGVVVNGTLVSGVLNTLNPAIDTLLAAATVAGLDLDNPFASGTVTLTEDDLLAAAGVADINELAPGTDLLSFVPAAVVTRISDGVNGILDAVQDRVDDLGLGGVVLGAALGVAQGVIVPVLDGLADSLEGPLGDAITALAQLQVNVQSTDGGTFTQTALRVGLGTAGAIATVDLATASVGPNAGQLAVPVAGPESLALAGGGFGLAAVIVAAVMLRRRSQYAAAPAQG